jgi:hypothetical protein
MAVMIIDRLKALGRWIEEKIQAVWPRLEQKPQVQDNLLPTVEKFLTSPLTDTEYALMKRVSVIAGMAVVVYLVANAGMGDALVVIELSLLLGFGLYKFSHQGQE